MEEDFYIHTHQLGCKIKAMQDASILVAEDNLVNQILIRKILKKCQVGNLVITSDGQEAINEFERADFDVVLTDIQMPVLDGFTVAKYIRENKDLRKRKIPILVLSASSYHEIKDEMDQIGIDDFVEKPFTPDTLIGKLTEYLNSKDIS